MPTSRIGSPGSVISVTLPTWVEVASVATLGAGADQTHDPSAGGSGYARDLAMGLRHARLPGHLPVHGNHSQGHPERRRAGDPNRGRLVLRRLPPPSGRYAPGYASPSTISLIRRRLPLIGSSIMSSGASSDSTVMVSRLAASPSGSTVIHDRSSMGPSRTTAPMVRSGSNSMISISPSTGVSPARLLRILVPTPMGPGVSWTRLSSGSQRGWFSTWSVATKRNTSAGGRSIDSETSSFTAPPPYGDRSKRAYQYHPLHIVSKRVGHGLLGIHGVACGPGPPAGVLTEGLPCVLLRIPPAAGQLWRSTSANLLADPGRSSDQAGRPLVMAVVVRDEGEARQTHRDAHGVTGLGVNLECLPGLAPRSLEVADHPGDHGLSAQVLAQLPCCPFVAKDLDRGSTRLDRAGGVAPHDLEEPDAAQEVRGEDSVAGLLGGGQAFPEDRFGTVGVLIQVGDEREIQERGSQKLGVSDLSGDIDGLLVGRPHRRIVVLPIGDPPKGAQRENPRRASSIGTRHRQKALEPAPPLREKPSLQPEPPDGRGGVQAGVRIPGSLGPVQRGSQVVMLPFHPGEPHDPILLDQVALSLLCQVPEVLGVAAPDLILLSGRGETLHGELPDRLQHGEPGLAIPGLSRPRHAVIRQILEPVENPQVEAGPADDLSRFEAPAAAEDSQAGDQALRLGVEQVMAPLDRAAERSLPFGKVAGSAGEERKTPDQALQQDLRAQDLESAGSELDGQRQAVEPSGYLGHRGGVLARDPKARPDGRGSLREQRHGLGPSDQLEIHDVLGIGDGERRKLVLLL